MVYNSLISPKFIPLSPPKPATNLFSLHPYLPYIPIQYSINKRDFPLPAVSSIPYPPINVDYLENEFSGHGVTFTTISDSCVVKMGLDNGSLVSLMLPSGLITSYKAPMWHGGTLELLHTSVSEGESGAAAVIQGGVSLAFKCESDGGVPWSPSTWALHDVKGTPQGSIQVELISRNSKDMVEVKHILTLRKDLLSSEIVVSNTKSSSLGLMGSMVSHLTVSTPEATYAVGLEGSNFFSRPPFLSNFSIIPPDFVQGKDLGFRKLWSPTALVEYLSSWGVRNQNTADDAESREGKVEEEMEGEETDNYKHLTEKMSMIYTDAPRYMTVIDRGRRNSVILGRDGFNELYMFSPGSSHEWYGKYAYICVGQAALLEPINIDPEGVWRGWQHIHNPNL
ncbi:protein NDH-DEPENDENT CYCLIC ELECTRON FLOW 5 [Cornus florida]|uniref:protein NDH-DEPENDENT CYCLIC ELECTRON FLOW 5 n=1 Tax=Cornus florida TaxID=4283 RepID=UPI00289D2C0B|nr:protein NDH-DEPENDENT CYCLIC ELECTRON FLOW 5 [Cornus florida]